MRKRFFKSILWIVAILFVMVLAAVALFMLTRPKELVSRENPVGIADQLLVDEQRQRELATYFWYASDDSDQVTLHHSNAMFYGFSAAADAKPSASEKMPLVVFSHGSGGNRSNQAWLAIELARQGALVVASNHPGSTSRDSAPATNILVWNRPQDISFLLDTVLADEQWGPLIDPSRIALVGHSLGGYTVLAEGGGTLSLDAFQQYCTDYPGNPDCTFYRSGNVDFEQVDRQAFESSFKDERVGAIVSIDPAFAKSFVADSLSSLPPTLLIKPKVDVDSADDLQVDFLRTEIEQQTAQPFSFMEIEGAHHFSFLSRCKPYANIVMEIVESGAGVLCAKEEGVERVQIQEQTSTAISDFLHQQGILR